MNVLSTGEAAVLYYCKCGSATVDVSLLTNQYTCGSCNSSGSVSELLMQPLNQDSAAGEAALASMVNDLKKMMASEVAKPLIVFLDKWGFISQPLNTRQIGRFLQVAAASMIAAFVEERRKIMEEQNRERYGHKG